MKPVMSQNENRLQVLVLILPLLFSTSVFAGKAATKKNNVKSRTVASTGCEECAAQKSVLNLPAELAGLKAIIGVDDRYVVRDPIEEEIYSGIGAISCHNPAVAEGYYISTAFLVGSRSTVAGTAHGFWANDVGRRYDPIQDCVFRLVSADGRATLFESRFREIRAGARLQDTEQNDDWSVLSLVDPAPTTVRFYGVKRPNSLNVSERHKIRFAAFQRTGFTDMRIQKFAQNSCSFWREENSDGDPMDPNGREVYHDCDTLKISSGGPLLYEENGSFKIVGINTRDGDYTGSKFNRALRVTEELFTAIQDFSTKTVAAAKQ